MSVVRLLGRRGRWGPADPGLRPLRSFGFAQDRPGQSPPRRDCGGARPLRQSLILSKGSGSSLFSITDLPPHLLLLPECAVAIARPTADARLAEVLVWLVKTFSKLQLIPLDLPLAHHTVQIAKDHRLRGADSVYVSVAETSN